MFSADEINQELQRREQTANSSQGAYGTSTAGGAPFSEDEISRELQHRQKKTADSRKINPGLAQHLLGQLGGAGSFLGGAQQGVSNFVTGTEKLGAQGLDYVLGSHLAEKVKPVHLAPHVNLIEALQKAHPTASSLGEFTGEAIPAFLAPSGELEAIAGGIEKLPQALRGAARLGGRIAKGAPTGAALAAIQSPGDQKGAAKFGAAVGAVSPVAEKAIGAAYGLGKKGLSKLIATLGSGTNTLTEIGENVEALENIGLHKKMPLGNIINSPGLKGTSSFIGTIPGSRVAKNEIEIGKSIKNTITNSIKGLAPSEDQNVSKNLVSHFKNQKLKQEAINHVNYGDFTKLADESNTILKPKELSAARNRALKDIDEDEGKVAFKKLSNDKEVMGILGKVEKLTSKGKLLDKSNSVVTEAMVSDQSKRDLLNTIYKFGSKKAKKEIEVGFNLRADKKNELSFKKAADLKQEINQVLGETKEDERSKRSLLRSIKSGLMSDVQRSADESGNQNIVEALKRADKHHMENVVPLREKEISKFISGKERAEKIIPHFLKDGSTFEQPELLSALTKNMSQKNKDNLAHAYLTKKSRTILDKDTLDEDKMLDAYKNLGNKVKRILFKPSVRRNLDSAHVARKMTGKSINSLVNPAPTAAWDRIKKSLPFLATLKVAGIPGAVGASVLANALTRGIKSEKTRNIYINSLIHSMEKGIKPKNIDMSKLTNISIPELTRMLQGTQQNG